MAKTLQQKPSNIKRRPECLEPQCMIIMVKAKKLQLNLKPSGTGYVTEQSVAEGTLLQPGTELGVTLVPPLEPQQEAEKP